MQAASTIRQSSPPHRYSNSAGFTDSVRYDGLSPMCHAMRIPCHGLVHHNALVRSAALQEPRMRVVR
jgi:hypothetical protein